MEGIVTKGKGKGSHKRAAPAPPGPVAKPEAKPPPPEPEPPGAEEVKGIECLTCGCRHFETLEVRATVGGKLRRRRQCRYCGRRVTTYEAAEDSGLGTKGRSGA